MQSSITIRLPGRRQIAWCLLLGLLLVMIGTAPTVTGQASTDTVLVVEIHNEIDLGLAPFLARVLDQAARDDARAVILEINTPGGRLDAVLQMRTAILATPVRTIAFVNREAFSAGALITIAAREIYMAPGAVMGAATPVDGSGTAADEKTISAVRATFKSTAESRARDPLIAEAMVDMDVAIAGLVERGELLTLTAEEAQDVGYADGIVSSRQELLRATELEGATIKEVRPSPAENLVRFLTNPLVASLLVSLGFVLILVDLYTAGFGIIGGVGLLLFVAFFWGHFLAGLAGWEGVALVVLGLALVGAEIFVIPGFGVAGLLGAAALLGGIFISLIGGTIVTSTDLTRAALTIFIALLVMIAGAMLVLRLLPGAGRIQGLILKSQVGRPDTLRQPRATRRSWLEGEQLQAHTQANVARQEVRAEQASLRGATGVALTDLRPGGFALLGGERVDVVTRGDYITAGDPIEVVADEGYRRVVRRSATAQEPQPGAPTGT